MILNSTRVSGDFPEEDVEVKFWCCAAASLFKRRWFGGYVYTRDSVNDFISVCHLFINTDRMIHTSRREKTTFPVIIRREKLPRKTSAPSADNSANRHPCPTRRISKHKRAIVNTFSQFRDVSCEHEHLSGLLGQKEVLVLKGILRFLSCWGSPTSKRTEQTVLTLNNKRKTDMNEKDETASFPLEFNCKV